MEQKGNRRIEREWKLAENASKKALKFKLVKRQIFFHFFYFMSASNRIIGTK